MELDCLYNLNVMIVNKESVMTRFSCNFSFKFFYVFDNYLSMCSSDNSFFNQFLNLSRNRFSCRVYP